MGFEATVSCFKGLDTWILVDYRGLMGMLLDRSDVILKVNITGFKADYSSFH